MEIALPYNLTEEALVLEPTTRAQTTRELLRWLLDTGTQSEELDRIFRATSALWELYRDDPAIPFNRCLDTAIIWERG
jgi:hypothetical protein